MRKGLIIFSAFVIMAALAGMALPIAQAEEAAPGDIYLHVLPNETNGSINLETIPADAQDKILITGSSNDTQFAAAIANLCGSLPPIGTATPTASPTPTGTPPAICGAVDIFYQVSLTLSWDSGLRDDCSLWGVCTKNVAPTIKMVYGGAGHNYTMDWGYCGEAGHATGSCNLETAGTISSADITNSNTGMGDYWNEKFDMILVQGWGTETLLTNYTIILSTQPITQECSGQYNIGAALASFTLAATNSTGVNLQNILGTSYPAPGQWYAVTVDGTWKNNGIGTDLKTVAHKVGVSGAWFPLFASPDVGCVDTGANVYYLQMISADAVYMRVYDTDGNWANSGTLTITISSVAAYSPYPTGCELQYQVGDLIEQRSMAANLENGHPLAKTDKYGIGGAGTDDPQPKRYYMLETIGGPGNLGAGDLTWEADMGLRDSEADSIPSLWYEIQTAPFVECVHQTDIVGHVRVFFAADTNDLKNGPLYQYFYAFRVRDTGSYADNSGSLGYRLYEATNMQMTDPGESPTLGGCDKYSHEDIEITSLSIQATNESGDSLPVLTSLSLYALEVVNGPWKEGGVTDSYSIELSDDGGDTWIDLEDYPDLLCAASADGDHTLIYLYGAAGKHWKARVNDQDSNFGNNTQSIGLNVYPGLTSINEWPACSQNYTFTPVYQDEEARRVPGNMEDGKGIPQAVLGAAGTYAIEILDGQMWYETGATAGSYLVDISNDSGATWTSFEDYPSLCVEQVGSGDRYRIVFQIVKGGGAGTDPPTTPHDFKLRVRDGDDDFLSNTGYVVFQVSMVINNNPAPGDTNPAPAEWIVVCNEAYARPDGYVSWEWVNILGSNWHFPLPRAGEWIDYLRNAVTYYFAWCPQHTDALKSVGSLAMDKDPMATIVDMVNYIKSIKALLEGYMVGGGADESVVTSQEPDLFSDTNTIGQAGGGASGPEAPVSHGAGAWDLFVTGTFDPAKNVWFGGKVDLTSALDSSYSSATDAYVGVCTDKFDSLFGIFTTTFCGVMGMMRYSDVINWILLVLDLFVSVWFIFKYIPGYLKKTWALFSGNKGIVQKVAGR